MSKEERTRKAADSGLEKGTDLYLFVEGSLAMLDKPAPGVTSATKITNLLATDTGLDADRGEDMLTCAIDMACGREDHRGVESVELRHNADDTIDLHARFAPKPKTDE